MPILSLPQDLSEQLNKSASGTINNTDGPGVAVYWASDGSARADIYIGLKLDGFNRYQDISSTHPDINMQFSISPVISCQDDLTIDPSSDKVIHITVSRRSQYLGTRNHQKVMMAPLSLKI